MCMSTSVVSKWYEDRCARNTGRHTECLFFTIHYKYGHLTLPRLTENIYLCLMQSFRIIKPLPELVPYIRNYWILKDNALVSISERTLPVGCVQLVFHKGKRLLVLEWQTLQPNAFICGQSFDFSDVCSTGEIGMITVVFQPYAAKIFLRLPLNLFFGQNISTADLEDVELQDLVKNVEDTVNEDSCVRLIELFLLRRLVASSDYHLKRISDALFEINRQPQINISQLAVVSCWSSKQFSRVFTEYVGATPKDFMRIVRMQRALHKIQCNPTLPLVQVAYECGFTDQSHMIKEFKLFSGYTPTEYMAVCAPYSDYFSNE